MTMTIWSETYGIVLLSLTLSSPAAAGRAVEDLSVRHLEQIRETTDRDFDFNPASSEPFGDAPVDSSSGTSPGGELSLIHI